MSQSYYIGLDVSARTINLCVVNAVVSRGMV